MIHFQLIDVELLVKCFCIAIVTHCFVVAVIEISVLYVLISIILYTIIHFISIPLPKEPNVDAVLGPNHRTRLRNQDIEFEDCIDETYFCIAYRAAGFDGIENSLNAITMCAENGCKFVHLDVRITADDIGVVSRQKNIVLARNGDSLPLEKTIEESTLEEISESRIFNANSLENTNEKIPTIEDAILQCDKANLKMILNVIHSSYYKSIESTVNVILKLYQKYPNLHEKCAIVSSNPIVLYKIRKHNNDIVAGIHWKKFMSGDTLIPSISWLKRNYLGYQLHNHLLEMIDFVAVLLLNNFIYRIVGVSVIIYPKEIITPSLVEYLDRKNVRCVAAVVNLSAEKIYYTNALGIAYLTDTLTTSELNSSTDTIKP